MTTTSTPITTPIFTPVTAGYRSQRSAPPNNNIRNDNISPSSSYTSSLGFPELPNSSSSSRSSGSKNKERSTLSHCVGRHESMWRGTTHSNKAQAKSGWADGAIQTRSERMSYITSPSLSSPLSFHSFSHYNLESSLSSPLHHSPRYITYAKGDDTVYSRVGGSPSEGR